MTAVAAAADVAGDVDGAVVSAGAVAPPLGGPGRVRRAAAAAGRDLAARRQAVGAVAEAVSSSGAADPPVTASAVSTFVVARVKRRGAGRRRRVAGDLDDAGDRALAADRAWRSAARSRPPWPPRPAAPVRCAGIEPAGVAGAIAGPCFAAAPAAPWEGSMIWWVTSAAPPAASAAQQTTAVTLAAVPPPATTIAPPPAAAPLLAAPPPAAPPMPSSLSSGRERPRAGRERGQAMAHAAQLGAVLGAPGAVAQVLARAPARADAAIEGVGEVRADLDARGVARLDGLDEPDPCAHEQRLHRLQRDAERLGELRVAQAVHLAHEQRRALLLGQPADVGDQAAQVVAALGVGRRVVQRPARGLEEVDRGRHGLAQMVDAAVVRDAVQPGAQRHRAVADAQRGVGAQEDVLQRVLGVLARAAEHLAGVDEQPLAVAVVDDAEGRVVAGAEEGDELLVGSQPQQRRRDRDPVECGGCSERSGLHVRIPVNCNRQIGREVVRLSSSLTRQRGFAVRPPRRRARSRPPPGRSGSARARSRR